MPNATTKRNTTKRNIEATRPTWLIRLALIQPLIADGVEPEAAGAGFPATEFDPLAGDSYVYRPGVLQARGHPLKASSPIKGLVKRK